MPDATRAAPLAVPRQSMLAAVSVTESETIRGTRWGFGVSWLPELPADPTSNVVGNRSMPWCVTSAEITVTNGDSTIESAYPFIVYAKDPCRSTMNEADVDGDPRNRQAKVRRLLEATQSFNIAREFWMGAVSAAAGLGNTWLKKTGSTSVGTGLSAANAVSVLDEAISDNLYNGRGMIHARPRVRDRMVQLQAIRREGNLWLTPMDNIVVSDSGYDGSGPSAGEYAFATTMVEVFLGPIRVSVPEEGFIRSTDDIEVWGERDAIVLHDPHLVHHSAAIDLSL